jgi:hypothetical protein
MNDLMILPDKRQERVIVTDKRTSLHDLGFNWLGPDQLCLNHNNTLKVL